MKFKHYVMAASACLWLFGCSGDQEEKTEEPVGPEGAEGEPAEPPPEEGAPQEDPAPEAAPAPAPQPAPQPAPAAPTEPAGFEGAAVPRYVTTYAVNVRSAPDKGASVVRYAKWGDKLDVVINGDWAKVANGEYVSVKALSENPPGGPKPAGQKGGKKGKKKGK